MSGQNWRNILNGSISFESKYLIHCADDIRPDTEVITIFLIKQAQRVAFCDHPLVLKSSVVKLTDAIDPAAQLISGERGVMEIVRSSDTPVVPGVTFTEAITQMMTPQQGHRVLGLSSSNVNTSKPEGRDVKLTQRTKRAFLDIPVASKFPGRSIQFRRTAEAVKETKTAPRPPVLPRVSLSSSPEITQRSQGSLVRRDYHDTLRSDIRVNSLTSHQDANVHTGTGSQGIPNSQVLELSHESGIITTYDPQSSRRESQEIQASVHVSNTNGSDAHEGPIIRLEPRNSHGDIPTNWPSFVTNSEPRKRLHQNLGPMRKYFHNLARS